MKMEKNCNTEVKVVKMTVCFLFASLKILIMCPVLVVDSVQTLTIDTQLGTSVEDCFERLSIGEEIQDSAIYRKEPELSTRECESLCKQDRQCQSYCYGVGAKGNATCNLSKLSENEIKVDKLLLRNSDFDVYVRRILCEVTSSTSNIEVPYEEGTSLHRPIIRPVDDHESDINSFDTTQTLIGKPDSRKPSPKPNSNYVDRLDNYHNYKPNLDTNVYGDHRPYEIPNKPEQSQIHLSRPKPDPYDVLYFHSPNRKPPRPEHFAMWRPDPYSPPYVDEDISDSYNSKPSKPNRPNNFIPEKRPYNYEIPIPIQRPSPDPFYFNNKPLRPANELAHLTGPSGPPERPIRGQHTTNNGHELHGDNSVTVIIKDPPELQKPTHSGCSEVCGNKGGYYGDGQENSHHLGYGSKGSYGYGSSNRYNSHAISSNSHYIGTEDRPETGSYRPELSRPLSNYRPEIYSQYQDLSYGTSSSLDSHSTYDRNNYRPLRPQKNPEKIHGLDQISYNINKGSYNVAMETHGINAINSYQGGHNINYNTKRGSYGFHLHNPGLSNNYGAYENNQNSGSNNDSNNYGSSNTPSSSNGLNNNDGYQNNYDNPYSYGNRYSQESESSNTDHIYQNNPGGSNTYLYTDSSQLANVGHGSPTSYSVSHQQSEENDDNNRYQNKGIHTYPYYSNRPSNSNYGSNSNNINTYDNQNLYGTQISHEDNNKYGNLYTSSYHSLPNYGSYYSNDNYKNPYSSSYSYENRFKENKNYQSSYESSGYYTDRNHYRQVSNEDKNPSYNNESPRDKNELYTNGTTYGNVKYERPGYDSRKSNYSSNDNYSIKGSTYDIDRLETKPVYEKEVTRPVNEPGSAEGSRSQVVTSKLISVSDVRRHNESNRGKDDSYEACFRRVLAGQRAVRSFVRRVITCETLEDCRRECATEKRFHCESFNYKLDPSFRGRGLCELMTKPIEAFNLRRDFVHDKDYDFYEIDRNSLEPYCPETLNGPGRLHSGFLSSKPSAANIPGTQEEWRDRTDSGYYNYDRFYDERNEVRSYDRRGHEEEVFVPYQIGVSRSNEEKTNWNQYNNHYGYDNYYKDKSDYYKSANHWRLKDIDYSQYTGVKPYGYDSGFNYNNLGSNYRQSHKSVYTPGHEIPGENSYGLNRYGYVTGRKTIDSHRDTHQGYYVPRSFDYGSWRKERWNKSEGASWNSLNYGETTYFEPPKSHNYVPVDRNDEDVIVKDCSSRRRAGMSLGSGSIRRSLLATNVVQCETACFNEREFKCVSYSYRYSKSHTSDNCFLSERPYKGLDMSADSDSDVYAMPHDHCTSVSHEPWVESECFWHVRSGAAVSGAAVKVALTVAGLGACEAECIRAQSFFCRGFSFRFENPTIGDELENCILTSTPPTSLDIDEGLLSVNGHELYARGNYGRGCEPAFYDDVHHKETQCYLQYDKSAKLLTSAIRGQARVHDEMACGAICTKAPFRCLSFSFSTSAPPHEDNCLLSDIRLFDLQRGVDYEHSTDDWLFAFDLFNGKCWMKVHEKDVDIATHELPRPLPQPPVELQHPSSVPDGPLYSTAPEVPHIPVSGPPSAASYLPAYPPYSETHIHKPDYLPQHHFKPSYPPVYTAVHKTGYYSKYDTYEPSPPEYFPSSGSVLPPSSPVGPPSFSLSGSSGPSKPAFVPSVPSEPGYGSSSSLPENGVEEPILVSWRHYTVSGFPCRRGTTCAQNQVGGHWACEPEGGEIGSWDYCCAPTHRCGYSERFHKPWCYVGPNEDQWRPCSEKYYPYHQHKLPHPSQGGHTHAGKPWAQRPGSYIANDRARPHDPYISEADRRYWNDIYKNGPKAYHDKYGNPLPGYIRVPTESRPYIKYHHNYPSPGSGQWLPVDALHPREQENPGSLQGSIPGSLGAPRYWPVAYLHKEPPPNMTYFKFNETSTTTTTEKYVPTTLSRDQPVPEFRKADIDLPNEDTKTNKNDIVGDNRQRDDKTRIFNVTKEDKIEKDINITTSTTFRPEYKNEIILESNNKDNNETKQGSTIEDKTKLKVETAKPENVKQENETDFIKGINGKIDDFSSSIEILDIEDAKGDKTSDLKAVEAEEKQIEEIGRLLAARRNGKIVIEKRSQKDLESKHISLDQDSIDFDINNKFPTPRRRGTIQKVSKDELDFERGKYDKSLEVSETTFVRPPRVLSTTENIRKTLVNGKVFYDATIREQRDLFANQTRKRNSRQLEESKAPSVIAYSNFGKKKVIKARNVNPVRRVKRVYKKRYNPEEVRRRLLDREKSKQV